MKVWILLLIFFPFGLVAQINLQNISIVRDSFGVPHIYGKTNIETAYGLAWAHAEDDFEHIQHNLLAGKGMQARVTGKEGAIFDYGLQMMDIQDFVNKNYEKDISKDFQKILEAYCQGLNDYAKAHPKEVLVKKALPFKPQDIICSYTLNLSLMGGVGMALKALKANMIEKVYAPNERGSNAIAISPKLSDDQKSWLLINAHQPIEGCFAFYEAHLKSDEGLNIIGGLFPGTVSILHGSNENLGWAHTVNYNQWGDIYRLELNPKNKKQYKLDNEWKNFRIKTITLHVKLAGIVIPVLKKLYFSEHGPVFKTKHGMYALRFHAYQNIKAAEQWHQMNLSKNFQEFEQCIKTEGITSYNIVYSDKDGNIFYQSNGAYPKRNPELLWKTPITEPSSKYIWTDLLKYEEKPTVYNPDCGYVFNVNNTPLVCTGDSCAWKGKFPGLQTFTYNRGERYEAFFKNLKGKITWNDFLQIKFDQSYAKDGCFMEKFGIFFKVDPKKYPDIADIVEKYKKWNLELSLENPHAGIAFVTHYFLNQQSELPFGFRMVLDENVSEAEAVQAFRDAKKFLMKTHKTLDVQLKDLQFLIRGDKKVAANGGYEVSEARSVKLFDSKKGIFRIVSGEGYIQLTKFSNQSLPEILSNITYGSSAHQESKHYNDQMEMSVNHQFKKMSLDWNDVLKQAKSIYHPGEKHP